MWTKCRLQKYLLDSDHYSLAPPIEMIEEKTLSTKKKTFQSEVVFLRFPS